MVAIIVLRVRAQFGAFYNQFDRELPLSTRIIVSFSNFAVAVPFHRGARRRGAGLGFVAWLKRPGSRRRFDKWILGLPTVGPTAQKFATSQATRTLATLLGGESRW